nr:MAG TPA: hypothetical protein [Caudoviricetes sp.]
MKITTQHHHTIHQERALVRALCFARRPGTLFPCHVGNLNRPFSNAVCCRFKSALSSPGCKLSVGFRVQLQNKIQSTAAFTSHIWRGWFHQLFDFIQLYVGNGTISRKPVVYLPFAYKALFGKPSTILPSFS